MQGLPRHELVLVAAGSALLVLAGWLGWSSWSDVFCSITNAACVWLLVRQHIANWPVGLLANAVSFVVFLDARLYADMCLQVVYFALGTWGWIAWLRGAAGKALPVTRATRWELLGVVAFLPLATLGSWHLLVHFGGAAPVWDALTTALCLAAMLLMVRKRIDNWVLWILADLIYVPLYVSRQLPLLGGLYVVLLLLCLVGLRAWRRELVRA